MIKAVIFDCFGVIITDAMQLVRQELDAKSPKDGQKMHDIILANNRGIITPKESNEQIAELVGMTVEDLRARIKQGEVKDMQLLEYVLEVRKSYKTAMLSNIARPSLDHRFTSKELTTYFDTVVVSGDIGYAKPEAEAYEAVAEQLNVRLDECLFIDDREEYCEAARAVGMQAIYYTSLLRLKEDITRVISLQK
jgi:HAD superfamily hydrolase (TIGR01509 family)